MEYLMANREDCKVYDPQQTARYLEQLLSFQQISEYEKPFE